MKPAPFVTAIVGSLLALGPVVGMTSSADAALSSAHESAAARQYLADSAPLDTVSARFQVTAMSWIDNPTVTNAEAGVAARPLIFALEIFKDKLESQKWPTSAHGDIAAMVTTLDQLVTDLRALSHDDLTKTSSWEGPLLHDDLATTAATNRVRRDFGLPPLA